MCKSATLRRSDSCAIKDTTQIVNQTTVTTTSLAVKVARIGHVTRVAKV